jgi:hypothetical protein
MGNQQPRIGGCGGAARSTMGLWRKTTEKIENHPRLWWAAVGVITKAWTWLMEWGGISDNNSSEYIRGIRGIIYTFARESRKVRCTTVYSPEGKKKDKHR